MQPTFLDLHLPLLGEVRFDAYLTLFMIGYTLATWLARREEDGLGRNGDRIVDLALLMLVLGVFGARMLSVLADGKLQDFINMCVDPTKVEPADSWARVVRNCTSDAACNPGRDVYYLCEATTGRCHPPKDCLEAFKFWHGGLAYYGGFLLAFPVGLLYLHKKKLGALRVADMVSPGIALGLFFGRMGCFFNGCCFGAETDVAWRVDFPGRPGVHPTQLYEAAGALALFALLYFVVRPRRRRHGEVFVGLLVGYGVLRFLLEFWRADARGGLGPLSTSQWISVPLIALGLGLLAWRRRRAPA